MLLACLDSTAPDTLKRHIIQKVDISLTGIACYNLRQLILLQLIACSFCCLMYCFMCIIKGCAETFLNLRKRLFFFNITFFLSFSFVFALEKKFFSWKFIINKFQKISPKVPDDKTDESSASFLRIDLNWSANHSLVGW